jgi:hypothetical protein
MQACAPCSQPSSSTSKSSSAPIAAGVSVVVLVALIVIVAVALRRRRKSAVSLRPALYPNTTEMTLNPVRFKQRQKEEK